MQERKKEKYNNRIFLTYNSQFEEKQFSHKIQIYINLDLFDAFSLYFNLKNKLLSSSLYVKSDEKEFNINKSQNLKDQKYLIENHMNSCVNLIFLCNHNLFHDERILIEKEDSENNQEKKYLATFTSSGKLKVNKLEKKTLRILEKIKKSKD